LLDGLDQSAGALQIGDELLGGGAAAFGEIGELGAPQLVGGNLFLEGGGAPRERRSDCQAGANRARNFVRNARDETAERGEPLGFDEVALRFAGMQRSFGDLPLLANLGKKRG